VRERDNQSSTLKVCFVVDEIAIAHDLALAPNVLMVSSNQTTSTVF